MPAEAFLFAFLLQGQSLDTPLVLREVVGAAYNRTTYEAVCRDLTIVIRFGNNRKRAMRGRVESVQVDGAEVAGAAQRLTNLAVDRIIDRVGILNCGYYMKEPTIMGIMVAPGNPILSSNIFFTLQKDRGVWVLKDKETRAEPAP